jgi:hypothetical protein
MYYMFGIDNDRAEEMNDRLKASGLYGLWNTGGETGRPEIEDIVRIVVSSTGTIVTFRVRFPNRDDASAAMDGFTQDVDLRFDKKGGLVDGSILKVIARGALWEGTISADAEERIWSIDWKRG